jgi:trehalose/maltose hydrolase-like predicted phosphorylase
MNQDYIKPDNWSIIEEGFDVERVKSSESLFSIGNGAMGQRANFEENYTGKTFQGSYIAGISSRQAKKRSRIFKHPTGLESIIEKSTEEMLFQKIFVGMKEGCTIVL